jgi:hypothetical protein
LQPAKIKSGPETHTREEHLLRVSCHADNG